MKIRIGNDFVFNWAIERGGLPEDLSSVLEKHLHLSVFGKTVELVEGVDYDIIGNVIRIEVTPAIANIIGTYKAEFHYILPDDGLIDDDRKCAVDVDAFQIVARTAQADDSTEFSMTSDMAIAFKGDKGDSAYQVWLEEGNTGTEEDYFAYLRQPAVDAGASISELEGEIQVSEGLRVQAESSRQTAESLRVDAELLRQTNTQEAISNAENATENANTSAQNADDAREAIQDDLALKANQTDLAQLESEVNLKEVKDNKQNSLAADGTGTKFPTVDAVNEGLAGVNNLIAELVYNSNREIIVDSVNVATSTFTRVNHGLINDNKIFPITNGSEGTFNGTNLTPYELYAGNLLQKTYWVVNATADTFQLSETQGGSVLVLAENAKMNLNAWHFEEVATVSEIRITGLILPRRFRVEYDLRINSYSRTNLLQCYSNNWLTLGSSGYTWDIRYPLGTLSTLITVDYYFTDVNAKYISNRSCIYADNGTKTIKEILPSIEHYQSNYYNYSRIQNFIGINFYSNPQMRALANGSTIRVYKV